MNILQDIIYCIHNKVQVPQTGFFFFFWFSFLYTTITTTTKSLQSCPTVCDPTGGSPPGSTVPGILQARTLELVAISFSNAQK